MSVFDPSVFAVRSPPLGAGRDKVSAERGSFRFKNPRWTHLTPLTNTRARGAKRAGLTFERKVLDVLTAIYGHSFRESPVIQYDAGRKCRAAIPDGILRFDNVVVIVEVKLSHTDTVWEQLMERYKPLVQALEPHSWVRTVEVCRYYDPSIPIPHTLTHSLHTPNVGLEVLQWKI